MASLEGWLNIGIGGIIIPGNVHKMSRNGGISIPGSVHKMSRRGRLRGHGAIQVKLGLGDLGRLFQP